ncbi:MAG: hypothetical protein HZA14_10380 [Nitrospirae bacterium]|nr:hypothetical protein [Nitrospirota bacterium]
MKKGFINNKRAKYIVMMLMGLWALTLFACGGGGGGSSSSSEPQPSQEQPPQQEKVTVSGVAATGAPVTGKVYLKDSIGNDVDRTVDITPDGTYTIDVTGLTAPFYLCAEPTSGKKLYSIAMGPGTANINPLTDLAVAAAKKVKDPADVYNDPGSHPITQDEINKVVADIRTLLDNLLDKYGANVNFLLDEFHADHTGLDKVFDDVDVNINTLTGKVTFVDEDTGNTLGETNTELDETTDPVELVVSGEGVNSSDVSLKLINVRSSKIGQVIYYEPMGRVDFRSTSITEVSISGNVVTIKGTGTVNDIEEGYSFTAVINDSNPDAMSVVISKDGGPSYTTASQPITNTTGGYTVEIK